MVKSLKLHHIGNFKCSYVQEKIIRDLVKYVHICAHSDLEWSNNKVWMLGKKIYSMFASIFVNEGNDVY